MCSFLVRTHGQERCCRKFTFGAEWGYICTFFSGYHYNFHSPEGYRMDSRGHNFVFDSNAEAYLHAGYNLNDKHNISVYMGMSAIGKHHHTVPVSLRLTRLFRSNQYGDRWLTFIDLGSGLSIKEKPQEILTGKIGGGYRLHLNGSACLDFLLALRSAYTHHDIEFYGTPVHHSMVNRDNAYICAISLAISLTF